MFDKKIEAMAKELHRRKCEWYRINDPEKIKLYWESCAQNKYRELAKHELETAD